MKSSAFLKLRHRVGPLRRPATAAIALLLVFATNARTATAQSSDWAATIEELATTLAGDVRTDDVGGLVAGVVVQGDLVWADAWGWADRDTRVPMSTASVSRTGSISKTVTALLMMRLVDQGVVGLDDPVERHLPEFARVRDQRPGADVVTLRHLASHTAGIVREPDWRGSVVGPLNAWEDRVLESLQHTSFDSIPGARYQYSNIGFGALGLALSRAADRPFMAMVREEVFRPLGMTGSEFVVADGELAPRLATGYTRSRDGGISSDLPTREHAGRGYKVPNGGVYSTVADLGRFLGAIAGVPGLRVVSDAGRRAMTTIQTPESDERGYGLGLSIQRDDAGRTLVGHGGSVAGYTATMVVEPQSGVGVILLRNYGGGVTNLGAVAHSFTSALAAIAERGN